jgi:putative inorganic carbon (HCO3(-)) transporter
MKFLPKDFLIDLSFYLIAGFLPVVFFPLFLNWFEFPKILIFYFLVLLILSNKIFKLTTKRSLLVEISSLDIFLLFFLAIYFLSSVFAINPKTALLGLYDSWITSFLTILFLFFFYLFLSRKLRKNEWSWNFSIFLVLGAALVATYALYQYFILGPGLIFSSIYRVSSTLGQPNYLGFYLALLIPFSLFIFLKNKNELLNPIFLTCFLLISAGLLVTFSRGAWLATFSSSVLVFLLWLAKSKKKALPNLNLKQFGILIFLLSLLLFFRTPFLSRIKSTLNAPPEQNTIKIRIAEWKGALEVFKARPILGVGPENLYYYYGKYRDPWLNYIENEWYYKSYNTRNLYLDLLAKTGLIGFLSFILVLASVLVNLLKTFFTATKGSANETLSLAVLASFVSFLIISFYSLQIIYSQILFFILLSFTWSLTVKKTLLKEIKMNFGHYFRRSKVLLTALGVFLIFLGVFFEAKFTMADYLISSSQTKEGPTGCELISKGLKLNPIYSVYHRLLADCYFNLSGETYLEGVAKVDVSPQNLIWAQKALETIEKAVSTDPIDPVNYSNLSRLYFRLSKLDQNYVRKSIWAAQKLLEYETNWPSGWDSTGQGYLDLGELEKAKENFEKAISLKKDFASAHFHLGETLRQMGKPEEALSHYQLFQGPRAEQEIAETLKEIELKKNKSLDSHRL